MSNQTQDQFKGFTLVWEGSPTDFIPVIKEWSHLSQDYLQVAKPANPNNIALWAANEHIDWANYRVMGTYRPANVNNFRQSEAKMREYHQQLQEKSELTAEKFMESLRASSAEDYYNK